MFISLHYCSILFFPTRSSVADRGSMAQWSVALDLGSSLSGNVGSNPTAAIITISAMQFQSEHSIRSETLSLGWQLPEPRGFSILSSYLPERSLASSHSQRHTFGERTRTCDSKFTVGVNVSMDGCQRQLVQGVPRLFPEGSCWLQPSG